MVAAWSAHFTNGFDHMMAADMGKKYFSFGGSFNQIATANTRFNRGYAAGNAGERVVHAGGNHQTWRYATALKRSATVVQNFFILRDAGTNQFYCRLTPAGDIEVKRGNGTTIGTASGVVPSDTWLWVEIIVYIHGSAGVVLVFVSNVVTPVMTLTGVVTQETANAYAQAVTMQGESSLELDDEHVSWGSGVPVAADALPDSCIITSHAVTQGDHADFTPDSGTNHVDRVRDATAGTLADGDGTYLSTNAAGNKESMLFDDLPADVTVINMVQITAEVRKNDAAGRTFKIGTRRGGTDYESATKNAADTYRFEVHNQALDPVTSAAWTRANANLTQGMVNLVS